MLNTVETNFFPLLNLHSKKVATATNWIMELFTYQMILLSVLLMIIFILSCLHCFLLNLALCFRVKTAPVIGGLLLLKQLQPSCYQYREGQEYCVLHHIQSGSYADVFCVQDKRTGFQCAAKKVRMLHERHRMYIFGRIRTKRLSVCCGLTSGAIESLQQWGGEHMERS